MSDPIARCLYCGGPISAAQPTCSICRAVARFVTCSACHASVPAGWDKCTCGASLDPRRPASGAPACPRCPDQTLVLRRLSDGASTALQCERCHGCFVRVRDWTLMVDDSLGGHPIDTAAFVAPASGAETPDQLAATVHCPACGRDMDRFHFGLRSPAVVDVCDAHGMWLDGGELAQVLSLAGQIAAGGSLPAESAADRAADAALTARLSAEEDKVDRNVEIARANFRAEDRFYQLAESWQRMLSGFARLVTPKR